MTTTVTTNNGGCQNPDCPIRAINGGETARLALAKQAEQLSNDLMRFELRHREEKIARVILNASLGAGRHLVVIPRLDDLGGQLGISKGNVDAALEELHRMRIIRVTRRGKEATYEFNPIPDEWRCRALVTAEEARRCRDVIRSYNSGIGGDPENFKPLAATQFFGTCVPAGTVPDSHETQTELWDEFPRLD